MSKKKNKAIAVDKKIEKLIEIYKEAEKRLIKIIAEKEVKGNVTTFYKEMLKQVQQEILKLQIFHTQWATDITKQLYEQAYKEALEILRISGNETFTQLHKEAIELIAENIVNNLNGATENDKMPDKAYFTKPLKLKLLLPLALSSGIYGR